MLVNRFNKIICIWNKLKNSTKKRIIFKCINIINNTKVIKYDDVAKEILKVIIQVDHKFLIIHTEY